MTHFRQIPVMCFKVTGMLGPPVRYKYLLLAIYPSSTGTTRGILQLMSTPGERSEPQASEASPSRAKRGTLRRAKRGSEIVKSIELSAAPRRFTSVREFHRSTRSVREFYTFHRWSSIMFTTTALVRVQRTNCTDNATGQHQRLMRVCPGRIRPR